MPRIARLRPMRSHTLAALTVAAALTLTACSSSSAAPETPEDAMTASCDVFAKWASDGQPADERDQLITDTGEYITLADQRLQDAHAGLVRTVTEPDQTWQLASDVFASVCMDLGWTA